MAADTSLEQDYNLSFVSDLCREISLKRIKRHSFIDIITKGERERSIDPDEESHWISVIFLKNSVKSKKSSGFSRFRRRRAADRENHRHGRTLRAKWEPIATTQTSGPTTADGP